MAITTTGGSGSGTTAVAINTCYSPTLFTTPNTTNAIFIVTITWAVTATVPATGCQVITMGLGGIAGGNTYVTPPSGVHPIVIKVGPNTDVKVTWECTTGAGTVNWSYNWVGVVIT